jgi:hypothetical protein
LHNPGRLPFARALKEAFVTTVMVFPAKLLLAKLHKKHPKNFFARVSECTVIVTLPPPFLLMVVIVC